jgi:outer membrane protein assembly factor BamB
MKARILLSLLAGVAAAWPLRADDWPQFRGPDRSGVSKETGLLQSWPKGGPPLAWTFKQAGIGYSGPAVVGDRLYLMGARGDAEFVFALDLKSAEGNNVKELWATRIGPLFSWKGNSYNSGPSATPSVDGELVYALGGQGDLLCVEAATGKERWRKNLPADLGAEVNPIGGGPEKLGWGYTWSPLVDGEQLICVPGGSQGTLAAMNKKTGEVIWRSKGLTDQATYSSPIVASVDGVRQYIQMTNAGIAGVAAKDGELLWYYQRKPPYSDVVIDTPIFHDGYVYATVAFSLGCDLIKIVRRSAKFAAEKVYANKNLMNQSGGVILVNGRIYGYSKGKGWVCQDFKKGNIVWSERRKLGPGSLTAAEGELYCYGEDDGTMVLVTANTKGWLEKGRFDIPQKSALNKSSGKLWTHPVIANGRLYLRDQELLFCYDIRAAK